MFLYCLFCTALCKYKFVFVQTKFEDKVGNYCYDFQFKNNKFSFYLSILKHILISEIM